MRSVQRVTQRPFLFFLPLLLCQFLSVALSSCGSFQCESVHSPSVIPRLFIAGGHVYMFSEGTGLLVLQESSGKHLWQASGQLEAVDADQIYLSLSQDNTPFLEALRASDGKEIRQRDEPAFVLDRTKGILLTLAHTDSGSSLVALQARSGKVLWQRSEPQIQFGEYGQGIGLKLTDGTLYVGTWSTESLPSGMRATYFAGDVNAIRASDGTYLWQSQGNKPWDKLAVESTDVAAYILSYDPVQQAATTLTALRESSGTHLWQRAAPAAGLAFADDALYTGYGGDDQTSGCTATGVAHIVKYRATDGKELWHVQP